jgi:hypothetical protein
MTTSEDLDVFAEVAEEWGFVDWRPLPENDPVTTMITSIPDATWEKIAEASRTFVEVSSHVSFSSPTHSSVYRDAQHNELLKQKLRSEDQSDGSGVIDTK